MGRRLPVCALCGNPLRGARVLYRDTKAPGAPEVGWHGGADECYWKDKLAREVGSPGVIETIGRRGPGRVEKYKSTKSERSA